MKNLLIEKKSDFHRYVEWNAVNRNGEIQNILKTYPVNNFKESNELVYFVAIRNLVTDSLQAIATFGGEKGYQNSTFMKEVTFQKNVESTEQYVIWESLINCLNLPLFEKDLFNKICLSSSCIPLQPSIENRTFDASEISYYLKK